MLAKDLMNGGLISALLLSTCIGISEAFPKFLCIYTSFTTITKMFNGSFFLSDYEGLFWNSINDQTVFSSMNQMKLAKNGVLKTQWASLGTQTYPLNIFDMTFKTNFKGNCQLEPEKLFAFGKTWNNKIGFATYDNNKWIDTEIFSLENLKHYPVLNKVFSSLKTSTRIKAVLNFPSTGLLFIQDKNLFYVYCGTSDWQIVTDNVTNNVIIFENNYQVKFGQIFGGYVDKDPNNLYLFGGQITSGNKMVRKYVHKCNYTTENGKPSKIRLFCEKLIFRKVCDIKKAEKEEKSDQKLVNYGLIVAAVVLIILSIILIVLIFRRFSRKHVKKEEQPIVQPEKRPLALNRERVLGSESPKKILARNRTFEFSKKN